MKLLISGVATLTMVAALVCTSSAQTQTFTSLYSFHGGTDGIAPEFGVIIDPFGTLYGSTGQAGLGFGTVYKLRNGTKTTLYSFAGQGDGAYPFGGVVMDQSGTLYGTTSSGGASNSGTVFALDSAGNLTTLYSFTGGSDGLEPASSLLLHEGDLYGTTALGGGTGCAGQGCGTVYKVNIRTREETVLHSFTGSDGYGPLYGNLLMDNAGNLYGTTTYGGGTGCSGLGCGTVWELSAAGVETVLHSFTGSDGSLLFEQSLAMDTEGNLYGTAEQGGAYSHGVAFKVNISSRQETVLHSFTGGSDGSIPSSGLLRDSNGKLFGATADGGSSDFGVLFVLDGTSETVLHSFDDTDGAYPFTSLIGVRSGPLHAFTKIYGVTNGGGRDDAGTVFLLTP